MVKKLKFYNNFKISNIHKNSIILVGNYQICQSFAISTRLLTTLHSATWLGEKFSVKVYWNFMFCFSILIAKIKHYKPVLVSALSFNPARISSLPSSRILSAVIRSG